MIPRLRALGFWSAAGLAFMVSHTQAPLYAGNQTTKFLIGLARAGRGGLARDWLAGAVDPLPAFTALVRLTYGFLPEATFYAYYAVLAGIYLYALFGIADRAVGLRRSGLRSALFLAVLFVIHSRLVLHFASVWGLGDLPLLFREGVAHQYVLGRVFQPCVFGAFLLLAVRLHLEGRRTYAALALAVAAVFHPAYLLPAALLILAFSLATAGGSRRVTAVLGPPAVLLLLVAPVLLYSRLAFAPHDPVAWRDGLRFLVHDRIPYHSLPGIWFDRGTFFQALLMAAGVLAAGRNRLGVILAVPFGVAFLLTAVQIVSGSDVLAFLAPWRVSAVLVPVSVALLAARGASALDRALLHRPGLGRAGLGLSTAATAICVVTGAHLQWTDFRDRSRSPEASLYAFARAHLSPGDLYLLPPLDRRLDAFRLMSGAPILINWKSHPYRMDDEFGEWRERIRRAGGFYGSSPDSACAAARKLECAYGITHAVVRRDPPDPVCPGWREIYENGTYAVYRLPANGVTGTRPASPLGLSPGVP